MPLSVPVPCRDPVKELTARRASPGKDTKKGGGCPPPGSSVWPKLEAEHLAKRAVRRRRNPARPVAALLLGPPDQIGFVVAKHGADALGDAAPDAAKVGVIVYAQALCDAR